MRLFPHCVRPAAVFALFPVLVLLCLNACDNGSTSPSSASAPATDEAPPATTASGREATPSPPSGNGNASAEQPRSLAGRTTNPQFTVGTQQYVFDVSDHTREELMALLKRADEISTTSSSELEQLEIALVLHGPDIDWFAKKNYAGNKELVDLAARLDALEVIDLKVCQKAMQQYGYLEEDIPAFIDRVPYAPDEMRRLEGSGYLRL